MDSLAIDISRNMSIPFLLHQKAQRWVYNEKKVSLEQTKHLW